MNLMVSFLLLLFMILQAPVALAGSDSGPSSLAKGVLLVASPSLNDPNFHQTVVLILEHGPQGTVGLVRSRGQAPEDPARRAVRHGLDDTPASVRH